VRWRQTRLSPLVIRSGEVTNPAVLARDSVKETLGWAMVAAPVTALLVLMVTPWGALLAFAPLVVLVMPELRLRDRIAQRREGVDRELPFFSVVVNILAGAGIPLYSIIRDMAKSEMFSSVKQEALLVGRDVAIFGMNPNDAIERLASGHPSSRFADFLLGYTSKARSGGDVVLYLTGESGALLRRLEEDWSRYVSGVGVVGSMMITMFGVIPLLLTVIGVFSPSFSVATLLLFTLLGVPLVAVGLLSMAGRMQPVREEPVRGRAGRSVLASLPGALAAAYAAGIWASVGAALFGFFVAYGLSVREQIAETRAIEEGLRRFLKDLLEFKRQEYDLTRAVIAIQAGTRYNARFDQLLSRVGSQLKSGTPLDKVGVACRSKLGKLAFLLLGQMSRSGGGTVDTVYQVSSFTDRMVEMKRNAAAEIRPYVILSYISPLLLCFGITFVGSLLTSFSRMPCRPRPQRG
jgi:pilus assembly protein TadC